MKLISLNVRGEWVGGAGEGGGHEVPPGGRGVLRAELERIFF